jgi:transposase
LLQIGLALGGNPGALLARKLGMPTSPSTLLRRVKALPDAQATCVRVLGVDDWALRKGQRYATILCDLEKRRSLELLPDRTAETLIAWLTQHPEIKIISRDRGGPYAAAADQAAPQAQQVADRFHLLKNLGEALKRLLDRHIADLNAVAASHSEILAPTPIPVVEMQKSDPAPTEVSVEQPKCAPTSASRERRLSGYTQVRRLAQQGVSERGIARQCALSRDTVRKYVHADAFPERATGLRLSKADRFAPLIVTRLREGGHTLKAIWEELGTLGYTGAYSRLSIYARQIYPAASRTEAAVALRSRLRLSAWSATWLFLRKSEKLSEADRQMAAELCDRSSEIARANEIVQGFARLIRERRAECLDTWLDEAANCGIAEMVNFARGIRQDYSAVKAALSLPWSNGQVEGQVNRLKLVKRTMYGRAGLPLLRKRFLPAR